MPTVIQVIDKEIPHKGKCYLICTAYDPQDFSLRLAALAAEAEARGAFGVFFACKDAGGALPPEGFEANGIHFVPDGAFFIYTKELRPIECGPLPPLRLKSLRPAAVPLYITLFNESFFDVPNSMTMDEEECAGILSDPKQEAGFFMEGGLPVGVYQLDFSRDVPEIAAIGIREDYQGRGYGRQALAALEERLAEKGYRSVQLLVSSRNARALRLYRAAGYANPVLLSRWYRMQRPA